MTKLNFIFPIGGALSIRGLSGKASLVDQRSSGFITVSLDPQQTVPGKRLSIPMVDGLPANINTKESFFDIQISATANFVAGTRIVNKSGVYDSSGKRLGIPRLQSSERFGVEIDAIPVLPGPNLWISWTISKIGDCHVRILADGTVLREKKFTAKRHSKEKFHLIKTSADLKLKLHTDMPRSQKDEEFFVGEPMAFGFRLDDLKNYQKIEIKV